MKRFLGTVTVMFVLLALPTIEAQSSTGSFVFTLGGYTIRGGLADAFISQSNSVSMTMNLRDTMQTSVGNIPIGGSGSWRGFLNGTTLNGTIDNVQGSAKICIFFFFCGDANYIGQGTWTGTLSGTQGSGSFQGTITFTSSPVSQIPVNQPIPISGTWNSNFQR